MVTKKGVTDPFLANLLASHGVTPVEIKKQEAVAKATPTDADLLDTNQRTDFRGEAVVVSLEHPLASKIVKECKRPVCSNIFTTNYRPVGYCSRRCLELDLSERFGLAWIPDRDLRKERWEIRAEPFMIPESALVAMKQLVTFVENSLGRSLETGPQKEFPQVQIQEPVPHPGEGPEELSTQSLLASLGIESPSVSPQEPEPEIPAPLSHKTEVPAPKEPSIRGFEGLFAF